MRQESADFSDIALINQWATSSASSPESRSGRDQKNRYLKRYGKSEANAMDWRNATGFPLAYVQFQDSNAEKPKNQSVYTPEGRAEMHDNRQVDMNSNAPG